MKENIYIDQAMIESPGLFAAVTVYGIQEMDAKFTNRILDLESVGVAIRLAVEIQANKHLHQEIKDNLIGNLVTITEGLATQEK